MDVQILWPQKGGDKNLEVLLAFSSKNGKSRYKEGTQCCSLSWKIIILFVILSSCCWMLFVSLKNIWCKFVVLQLTNPTTRPKTYYKMVPKKLHVIVDVFLRKNWQVLCLCIILPPFLNICLSRGFKWLPHTDVYRHILECRFTHFDPYVVTCWNLISRKTNI